MPNLTLTEIASPLLGVFILMAAALTLACVDRVCKTIERVHGWRGE